MSHSKLFLGQLKGYQSLILAFIRKDFLVRYAQTFLGYLWAIINPLITVAVLSFAFGVIGKVETGTLPQSLFTLGGTGAWIYLSSTINDGSKSIVEARSMITKIYFPRIILPLSKALVNLIDFLILTVLTILLTIISGNKVSSIVWFIPFLFPLFIIGGLGISLWISALCLRFKDVLFIIPLFLRAGLFLSPIAYSSQMVPESYLWLYFMNPFSGLIEVFRAFLFEIELIELKYLACSLFSLFLLFFSGLWFFKKTERMIADYI